MNFTRYTDEDLAIFKRNRERGIPGTSGMSDWQHLRELTKRMARKAGKIESLCCEECGSNHVTVDAVADWNEAGQRFELADAMPYDKSVNCQECEAVEMSGEWRWIDRPGPLWCCPHCGCTDIDGTAWVHVNTDKPTQDEPPTDYYWCPQCDAEGWDGSFSKGCAETMIEQPFDATKTYRKEAAA